MQKFTELSEYISIDSNAAVGVKFQFCKSVNRPGNISSEFCNLLLGFPLG